MQNKFKRSATIRAASTKKPGEFEAVLFTGGEASDGHILDIRGAALPEKIPMFVNHFPDPTEQVGSFYPRVEDGAIVARGEIFMEGEGAAADIRRDLAAKIAAGHVGQVSGRWDADPEDVVARTSLPKDHPAHVDGKATGSKRYGSLFQRWRAMEGSVVGLGADPAAVMRFADDDSLPAHVRTFWADQAVGNVIEDEDDQNPKSLVDAIDDQLILLNERLDALERRNISPAVEDASRADDSTHEAAVEGGSSALRVFERFDTIINERDARILAAVDEMIARARGRVTR